MLFKKCKAAIILCVFAITALLLTPLRSFAAVHLPYYYLDGTYDSDAETYTIEVYLYSDEVIDTGTFGIHFGETIEEKEKTITLDTQNWDWMDVYNAEGQLDEIDWHYDPDFAATNVKDQFVATWISSPDIYSSDGTEIPYKIHLCKIELTEVAFDELSSTSFQILDWTTTPIAASYGFTEEIWREGTEIEKADGVQGYYQGLWHYNNVADDTDEYKWVDIDFRLTSDPPLQEDTSETEFLLKCKIMGYNPNQPFIVKLYAEDADIDTDDPLYIFNSSDEEYEIYLLSDDDGWTTWEARLNNISLEQKYKVVISKTSHLTYPAIEIDPETQIIYENNKKVLELEDDISLICGDISGDEIIKLPDRIMLLRVLLGQYKGEDEDYLAAADLNGDGRVTLMDLLILHTNFEKDYSSSVDEPEETGGGDSP